VGAKVGHREPSRETGEGLLLLWLPARDLLEARQHARSVKRFHRHPVSVPSLRHAAAFASFLRHTLDV
jgi:hypothetical protein